MKSFSPRVLALLTVIPLAALMARPIIDVRPPGNLAEVDKWRLIIKSDSAYEDVWLAGWIQADSALVYTCTTHTFDLTRGNTTLRLADVRILKDWAAAGYEAFRLRSGSLPEGEYEWGVSLLPWGDVGRTGVSDFGRTTVRLPGPPRLIAPQDGRTLTAAEKYPLFSWIPPQPPVPGVKYGLRVVEMLPGQSKEEAVRANEPRHEGRNIASASYRYPLKGRALAAGKHYAWQVRAFDARGAFIGESEVWAFLTPLAITASPTPVVVTRLLPPLHVEREIERTGTCFTVTLTVTNQSSADLGALHVFEQSDGLQYVNRFEAAVGAEPFRAPVSCLVTQVLTPTAEGSRVDLPWSVLGSGQQLRLRYQLVPVLHSRGPSFPLVVGQELRISYFIGFRYYSPSFASLADTLEAAVVDAAFRASDYLIITSPGKLFDITPPGDRRPVYDLLAKMAELASLRQGVLGYLDRSDNASQVKNLFMPGGAWSGRLGSLGYVLLVGEDFVVPAVRCATPELVSCSDNWYADLEGHDHAPEIAVGRIVGDNAEALALPIAASIEECRNPAAFDRSHALLVSGDEGQWELFTIYTDWIAHILTRQGTRIDSVHHEYYTDEVSLLRSALAILGSAWGVWESGRARSLPRELEPLRHLTARWDFYGPSTHTGIDLPEPPTDLEELRSLISVSDATLVERLRRNRPGTYRIFPDGTTAWNAGEDAIVALMPDHDIYYWHGHGWYGSWNICNIGGTFGSSRAFILSESCLTGRYQSVHGAPESCHRAGAAVFIGATEVTYGESGAVFFGEYWPRHITRTAGEAFRLQKRNWVRNAGDDYAAAEFNYYGDPKFGGD